MKSGRSTRTAAVRLPVRVERLEPRVLFAQVLGYGFDETGSTALDSATGDGAQNGSILSGATRVSPGQNSGGALSFDGVNDKVTFGSMSSLAGVGGITLAAWIDPASLSGAAPLQTIVAVLRGGSNTNRPRASITLTPTGAIRAGGRELDSNSFNAVQTAGNVITAAQANAAMWLHVAGVFNYATNTMSIYLNGSLVTSGTVSGWGSSATASNTATFSGSVGSNGPTNNEQYRGLIDDVRIFNTALTAGEIAAVFNSTAPTPTGPTAPGALAATAVSGTQMLLSWQDNSSNEQGFRIERKTGAGGTYQEIAQVGPGVTSYLSSQLTPNTSYVFRVRAFNAIAGEFSIEAAGATNDQPDRPAVGVVMPATGAAGVLRDAEVTASVYLPVSGIDENTLGPASVKLRRLSDMAEVPTVLNTSGGGDVIVLRPQDVLAADTTYRFEVTVDLKDLNGNAFAPFQSSFTTGTQTGAVATEVRFDRVALPGTAGVGWSSLAIGPDGKLYALANDGRLARWTINADGTLGGQQTITTLRTYTGSTVARLAIGLAFDPASTADNLIAWVTHTTFGFSGMADWGGKLTRLSGANLQTAQDYIVNLPRSQRDHLTNQLAFGPDGKLYFSQGANNSQGGRDTPWGGRSERLLTAAILRADTAALATYIATHGVPFNAYTGGLADDGVTPLAAPTPGPDGQLFDPFSPSSPLQLYATGLRNAYDLVWASNGRLYVPTNGSGGGGNTPATPAPFNPPTGGYTPRIDAPTAGGYNGPAVPATINNPVEQDFLFDVVAGGYYGHPNPARHEYVLNGGNPNPGADPIETPAYPVGTQPDRNYRGAAHVFGFNFSPNGVIQYKSNTFGGALKDRLLVVRYSAGDDIYVLRLGASGEIVSTIDNLSTFDNFSNPLDLVENPANGSLYVVEYGNGGSTGKITLLRPAVTPPTPPATPTSPGSPALTVNGSSQITVRWTDRSNNETGFRIRRATNSNFTSFTDFTVGPNVSSFVNTGLNPSTRYYYRVQAFNGSANSAFTSTVNALTPSGPPAVTAARLINADTDQAAFDLVDGMVISLSQTTVRNFSVQAIASSNTGSVRFGYQGNANYRVESSQPLALFGDNAGNFAGQTLAVGSYSLSLTPFSGGVASGTVGATVTLIFTVVA